MIRSILTTIKNGSIMTTSELAKIAGVQDETLEDILELLIRRKMIEEIKTSCEINTTCSACPAHNACTLTQRQGRSFRLTKKGEQYVRKKG